MIDEQQVVGPGPSSPSLGESRAGGQVLRAGHKRFFFDLGSNVKGDFLRITEVCLTPCQRVLSALILLVRPTKQPSTSLCFCITTTCEHVVVTTAACPLSALPELWAVCR